MTSSTDWYFPSSQATPGNVAEYWPDTYFLALPDPPAELESTNPESDSKGFSLDLSGYRAVAEHESVHWIQAQALGYGRFLGRIELAKSELAEGFFGLYPPDTVAHLIGSRRTVRPAFKAEYGKPLSVDRRMGPVAESIQWLWWCLASLRHELDQADSTFATIESTRLRYGIANLVVGTGEDMSQLVLRQDGSAKQRAELVEEARDHAPHGEPELSIAYPSLSSSSLAECAAVLNQLWVYAHDSSLGRAASAPEAIRFWEAVARSLDTILTTSYGDAFKAFHGLQPTWSLDEARSRNALLLACTIALDAPCGGALGSVQRWRDLLPPLRFDALVRSLDRVGHLPAVALCDLEPAKFHDHVKKWCDAADIALSELYDPPPRSNEPLEMSPLNDLRDLGSRAAGAAAAVYMRMPAAIVAPAETMTQISEASDLRTSDERLALCPPMVSMGGMGCYAGITEKEFALFSVGGAYQRLINEIFASGKPYKADGLPTNAVGDVIRTGALNLISRRLRVELPHVR